MVVGSGVQRKDAVYYPWFDRPTDRPSFLCAGRRGRKTASLKGVHSLIMKASECCQPLQSAGFLALTSDIMPTLLTTMPKRVNAEQRKSDWRDASNPSSLHFKVQVCVARDTECVHLSTVRKSYARDALSVMVGRRGERCERPSIDARGAARARRAKGGGQAGALPLMGLSVDILH